MAKLLETDALSNQDISSALEIGSYTADAERVLLIQVMADQVQGGGDYTAYITRQLAGAGSAYQSMVTTETVDVGVTAIMFGSIYVPVSNTDVVKVYLLGRATDTATPDTKVEFWQDNALVSTTADRTLDVSATGGVVIAANYDKTGYALSAAGVDAILDEVVEGTLTLRQGLRLVFAVLFGLITGAGTTSVGFRDIADTKNRVTATVTAQGNRTVITLDGT